MAPLALVHFMNKCLLELRQTGSSVSAIVAVGLDLPEKVAHALEELDAPCVLTNMADGAQLLLPGAAVRAARATALQRVQFSDDSSLGTRSVGLRALGRALRLSRTAALDVPRCGLGLDGMQQLVHGIAREGRMDGVGPESMLLFPGNPMDGTEPEAKPEPEGAVAQAAATWFEMLPNLGSICGVRKGQTGVTIETVADVAFLVADLAACRAGCERLRDVELSGVHLSDKLKCVLATKLPRTKLLRRISLRNLGNGTAVLVATDTELTLAQKQLGPADIMLLAACLSTEVTAGVTRVDVLGNPMGDSVNLLIDVFLKTERIRTMLGIEEGTVHLDLSDRKLDPAYVHLLAVELESSRGGGGGGHQQQ